MHKARGIAVAAVAAAALFLSFVSAGPASAVTTGTGTLVSPRTGMCITVAAASRSVNAHITQWPCNGSTAQQWVLGSGYIKNVNSGLCISDRDNYSRGVALVQGYCTEAGAGWLEEGDIIDTGSGSNPYFCVTTYGGSESAGAWLTQWTCSGSNLSQLWELRS
ncbi:RICIN domain-containing protein [Streptacidiphilus sp. EB103A]|uniref:RICIN domain-containing protein n=1 Tax=Streptacidiphilus sp. EB103A TaxID=3156275 RepID=UPI0035145648